MDLKKYIKIVLNNQELPSEIQFNFFEKQVRFFDGLQYEYDQDTLYLSYDDDNPLSIQMIEKLPRFFLPGFHIEECRYHSFAQNSLTQIVHPIHEEIDITVFPYISMFLAVILGTEKYESWYYSNFINVMCVNEKGFYNYTDDRSCFKKILTENSAQYIKSIKFTKETFIKSLFEKFYIYVWIDSCYTGDWNGTKQRHEAHPILIYGVNLEKNIYYCYRFSVMKGIFKCEYDIDMIHLSLESAKCNISDHVDDMHVSIFQTKEIASENLFDKYRFLRELNNYIFAKGNRIKEYCRAEIEIKENTEICFGLDVTKNVIELFKGTTQNVNFDYRMIHLLTEHKHLLVKRFQYVINLFSIFDTKLNSMIDDYNKLTLNYDRIKNYYMKESLKESHGFSFYQPPRKESTVMQMITEYEELIQDEKLLLIAIYEKFNYYLRIYDYTDIGSDHCFFAVKRVERDVEGLYQYLEWQECIETQKIYIYNLLNQDPRCCQGKMIINNGVHNETYEPQLCIKNDSIISFSSPHRIKWIKFYPQKYFLDEYNSISIGFRFADENLLNKSYIISPSSVFKVDGLDCSAENMLKEDKQFWAPTVDDLNRYVIFKFNSPISFNCCVLIEDPAALRISAYKIEYYDNDWKTAVYSEKIVQGYSKILFDRVTRMQTIRLSIIKTRRSPNGYDIPNITKFALYNLKENS